MRTPSKWLIGVSQLFQSMASKGRLMLSRSSGQASACISSVASATVRVMGPAARPV